MPLPLILLIALLRGGTRGDEHEWEWQGQQKQEGEAVGGQAQRLKEAALQSAQLVPAQTWWLITVLNSSSRGPDIPSAGLLGCQAHTWNTYIHVGKYSYT